MSGRIERALVAVSDKSGVVELAAALVARGVEIMSTGGTAKVLRDAGVAVREVAQVTGFPEIFGGRVKTLHPRIHGGILARRDHPDDVALAAKNDIPLIDLVVVNLYPFEARVAAGARWEEAIEEIDIGGPAMIRAAAKNHAHVTVVTNPADYARVLDAMERGEGAVAPELRRELAVEAFRRTAAYDAAISNWLGRELGDDFPQTWTEQWRKVGNLRYGENPHQRAAWYRRADGASIALPELVVRGEKELSYNNLLDAAAAIECVSALDGTAAVIVKHCLPCGAAEADDALGAFEGALAGDPVAAFGGILALNVPLEANLARRIATPALFFEVIYAPAIEAGVETLLRDGARWGKNCRLLSAPRRTTAGGGAAAPAATPRAGGGDWEARSIPGGVLVQERDRAQRARADFQVVSTRKPSDDEWRDLLFAWRTIPFPRSNAIVLASERRIVGVGAGQPSRVDAVNIACRKAGARAQGAVLASDAFFPFADGIEEAAKAGVRAVIQPGGSVRDSEVIAAAERARMAVVVTGERHFKH